MSESPDKILEMPETMQKELKGAFGNTVRVIADGMEKISEELKEFSKRKADTRERIKNGARRTSGRIV